MEQRIDQNMPPVNVAASDPARIPGLVPTEPEEANERTESEEAEGSAVRTPDPDEAEAEAPADTDADEDADTDEATRGEPAAEDTDSDAVTFEAADRRGGAQAGPSGIHFTLDDQETSFTWEEVGSVEHKVSLTGRWFHVVVSTVGHGRYQVDVSTNRKRAKEWQGELEAVLDAYFEA
ncbi:hypothetical protein [Streptomyces oceani]|uniref:Uncharacterized protein n=1 Tax=Streptomyces oceani TaxID=1075402 RepID=A0A1E7KID0_9ACTN|nr:hypothetical protein [Streptomyces oceani]OEV03718.1 hypothetical protein AN216_10320 [Streptomyces oceani]